MCQNAWRVIRSPRRVGEKIFGLALEQNLEAGSFDEALQPGLRLFAERNQSLAIPLAGNSHHALHQAHLAVAQVDQLGDTQSGCVEYFQHRSVATAERIGDVGRREQRLDLLLGKGLRQRPADLRHLNACGGIVFQPAFAHHVAVEAAEARQLTCGGARSCTALDTPVDEFHQRVAVGVDQVHLAFAQPACQRHQVGAIG
jgi:hypothetical protein